MIASRILAPAMLAVLFGTAAPALADGLFTPYAGATFGGDSAKGKAVFGASLGAMSGGVFGVELDVAHSPDFLDSGTGSLFGESSVTTAMFNLIVGVPIGGTGGIGVRPYASAGGGLIRAHVTSATGLFRDISRNDFGVNIGAGLMGFFSDHVGLRGDVRYFRSLQGADDDPVGVRLGDFNFMRATLGLTVRF